MKVLVIDDNPEDRILYRRYLPAGDGFDIEDVESFHEARQKFPLLSPDCVLVDFNLPDADGINVVHSLRTNLKTSPCAFVMVTGQGSESLAVSSFRSGVDDYVVKDGLTREVLQATVTRAIDRVQARLARERHLEELELFASVAAHDLKAPLQSIRGYAELTMMEDSRLDAAGRKDNLMVIQESCDRMSSLIDGLLDYAQSGSSSGMMIRVDVNQTFDDVLRALGDSINQTGAAVEADDLGFVVGDALGIHQVFQNLIANALHHVRADAPRVTVSAAAFANWMAYTVADNGSGVPERERERVFAPLVRLNGGTGHRGHGLGLAICQQVVERHGGHIWVEAAPGGGAAFKFTLPRISVT
jgi:signal transduction histidine kinase